ncbi:thioredoxin family protein [Candidatus Uhrbacteria bacterium]|nr:thioredoxin family protein [Candidatus Uhrbacteria bacterium]
MPRERVALAAIISLAALVFFGWVVQTRMENLSMPEPPSKMFGQPIRLDDMAKKDILTTPTAEETGKVSRLPVLAENMPEFAGITRWLNSNPLRQEELRGKVVLIDFWTYSCINCIRTLPYIVSWDKKYRGLGLVIIGVHTPEFAFEQKESNVRDALKRHGIAYPVAMDNDYGTWNAYGNRYWPAKYLFDAEGRLRYAHFGEGEYDVTEKNIQDLLADAGGVAAEAPVTVIPESTDFSKIGTSETYLGYGRMEYQANEEEILRDRVQEYVLPADVARNRFAYGGRWLVRSENGTLAEAPGSVVIRYVASGVNLVMGAETSAVRAEVLIDGKPVPVGMRGADLVVQGGRTYMRVSAERLYNVIDAKGAYGEHLLEIRFLDAGVRVYAFTFG